MRPTDSLRPQPPLCEVCHSPIRGRPEFLFSLFDSRNYGPFHVQCAESMTEHQDWEVRRRQYPEKYGQMEYEVFAGPNWQSR